MERTVLITGATRGIGLELARHLATAGLRPFVTGRDPAALEALRAELGCPGTVMDLRAPEASESLYQEARAALGHVDVLVNNAGFNRAKTPIPELTAADLDESYAVNVRAPILLARAALREMAARRSGHIVNILSSIVHVSMENYALYTAMKHALRGFTGCLIKEARPHGVKVTGICPGGVNTSFRPTPRPDYLTTASAAHMIAQCILAPHDVVVHELTFRPFAETNF